MRSIGIRSAEPEVGVATENGKSYYTITSLLKSTQIPYTDVLLHEYSHSDSIKSSSLSNDLAAKRLRLIITTRREKLLVSGKSVVCIEDLGEDYGLAKQRLLSILYPLKETDKFVVGIDPGERTGIAAFMNQIEVDSAVLGSMQDTIDRTRRLLDNAPKVTRIVKIGVGIPSLAEQIAEALKVVYRSDEIRIQLVDERGTSSLYSRGKLRTRTSRDQQSAQLIAFREGQDYSSRTINRSSLVR